jgi:ABC-type lipoprotein export system ATPase subunit
MTSLNPVFTVGYQLIEVLRLHMGMGPAAARKRAIALLDEVGIPDPEFKINAYPSQMSGGQQQRVMIAMAIACEPKLLIADEPTTALDVTIQKQILDLIGALQKKHQMSVLFITHDSRWWADRRLRRRDEKRRDPGRDPRRASRESAGSLHQSAAAMPAAPRPAPGAATGHRGFVDGGAHAVT